MKTAWKPGPLLAALACSWAFAGTTAASAPTPGDGVRQFDGKAYATSNGQLMYTESHWVYQADGQARQLVLYRCPDGKPFARKLSHDAGNPQAPDFELEDARTGYREGVRSNGGKRVVYVRKSAGAKEKSAPLDSSPLPVIDAGFDAYIRSHWNSLATGRDDTVPFLLPSRLGTVSFKISRMGDTQIEARSAHRYRLSLASWIGFALPHIDVAYDAKTRELLRFVGIANIRGDDGDNVRARIVFDPASRQPADAQALDAARTRALDGRCTIP